MASNPSDVRRRGATAALLDGGRRLHLQHGPIDVIVAANGPPAAVRAARQVAVRAFAPLLDELVTELAVLRQPVEAYRPCPVSGPVARRMWQAALPLADAGLTPMIAVAGAVADHLLESICRVVELERCAVNNGGDIAVFLGAGQSLRVGICTHPGTGERPATAELQAADGIGGVATSGWRGRSHSLGIADAVSVFAAGAASADAAATLIANAVDLPGHPGIDRCSARALDPDTDLGTQAVTVGVPSLQSGERRRALLAGRRRARRYHAAGHLLACHLHLQGDTVTVSSGTGRRLQGQRSSA